MGVSGAPMCWVPSRGSRVAGRAGADADDRLRWWENPLGLVKDVDFEESEGGLSDATLTDVLGCAPGIIGGGDGALFGEWPLEDNEAAQVSRKSS